MDIAFVQQQLDNFATFAKNFAGLFQDLPKFIGTLGLLFTEKVNGEANPEWIGTAWETTKNIFTTTTD